MEDEGAEDESWMNVSGPFGIVCELIDENVPGPMQRRKQQRRRRWRRAC